MNWTPDDGNDLRSFLLEEVGTISTAAEEAGDEFADIDWCDLGDALKEDFEDLAVPSSEPQELEASEQDISLGDTDRSDGANLSKKQKQKARRQCKEMREQSVLQYQVLTLSYIARLTWLNKMCNVELLQGALLSQVPSCLEEGVKLSLRRLKAQILKPASGSSGGQDTSKEAESSEISLGRLLGSLRGKARSMDLILLLVARCRAERRPARVVLALPLPGAKNCGGLLKGEVLSEPSMWTEIFDFSVNRWRALGVPSQNTSCWILGMGSDGDLWDVTARYGRWSNTLESRGSLTKVWDQLIDRQNVDMKLDKSVSQANELDQQWLFQLTQQEPVPTSRAHFKFHRVYILDSQLRQDQLVDSKAKPVGLFQGKEPIWRRDDVFELCTVARWRQQGRLVREDERPMKVLRRDSMFSSKLYGRWQTEVLPTETKEPVVGGPIPGVNNYGNIEVKQGIPAGTVHLNDEAARLAAPRLGVEFAPAVIDFRKERGQLKPVFSGCVIWARDEADLREAAEEEKLRLEELQKAKRLERLKGAWQLLVKKVLLDLYVESRYRSQNAD